jgi:GH18 family chitinase
MIRGNCFHGAILLLALASGCSEGADTSSQAASVAIAPPAAMLPRGGSIQFTATVAGADPRVSWAVREAPAGGSVADGWYVAPNTAGTYHVIVTSVADPTKSAEATVTVAAGASGKWVTGYYAGWFPEWYPPETVDMSAMTHFVFGRALPNADGTVSMAAGPSGNLNALPLSQRAHAAGIPALLMLGGVGDGPAFAAATATESGRLAFVTNILDTLEEYDFDGVDVDWEDSLETTAQQAQLVALFRDLRKASIERPRWRAPNSPIILTFPAWWVNANFGADAWAGEVAALVDQFNLMTYSMAGPWDGWDTWHFAALKGHGPRHPTSIESTVAAYEAAGVPRSKIGIGIGFYGHNYGPPNTGPGQAPSGAMGNDDVEWAWSELYARGYLTHGTYVWDDSAKMGYRSYAGGWAPPNASVAGFLSYEDEASIAAKGAWVQETGVGGTIVWTLNYGCISPDGTNPLLDAVKAAFLP